MSNPDTLLLYTDILDSIEDMPLDCLGSLFLALLRYQRFDAKGIRSAQDACAKAASGIFKGSAASIGLGL